MDLSNDDKIKAIEFWQNSKMHHLTCGNCRNDLKPIIKNGDVILSCSCGYIQTWVPDCIFNFYKGRIKTDKNKGDI